MIIYSRGNDSDIQEVEGRLVDVFVNELIRSCVTFLYEDAQDPDTGEMYRRTLGTAFLVAKSLDDSDEDILSWQRSPERYVSYLVTAGHVIRNRVSETIYIRVNTRGINTTTFELMPHRLDIPTLKNDWEFHPNDKETDVAVYHLNIPFQDLFITAVPYATLIPHHYITQENIGSGDEVFFIGLFTGHEGNEWVEPIIRFGHISLMLPFQKIEVYLKRTDSEPAPIEAYLVEARSHGGVSGSPVFLYWPPLQRGQRYTGAAMYRQPLPLILGLVFGQYENDNPPDGGDTINSGIAIVIPAEKIRETIMQKKLRTKRETIRKNPPKRKDAPKPVAGDRAPEFTVGDMMGALQKASRKIPQPESAQKDQDENRSD
jgi:hypothetical protein